MQRERQLERRQLGCLIGPEKIRRLQLKAGGDLLNLLSESGYGDHKLSDHGGVGVRRRQDLLKLLLGHGDLLHYRLERLRFLLLQLKQALGLFI